MNDTPLDIERPDELTVLKQRARLMGITHSNNIGLEALREKVRAKQTSIEAETSVDPEEVNPLEQDNAPPKRKETLHEMLQREQMKLVRLRITNLDPKKKDLPGEILTVANEYLGTVKKYIPFGEVTEEGYHVPYILYTMLKDKKFLNVRVSKGGNGNVIIRQNWAPEFALEILPPLTQEELNKLGTAQIAAGVFANDELI